ncbi:PREDICTED: serine-protein kinase ATM isoform X1 [Polistes dominula]|uniref:non-specific serine/threonine protein kinase n=2 Tax=Polistes dominula TaxID=743375 RepID=A0ABM1J2W7_POLDO|nr:PREDICTED: serine-protein kinase ATM isoform X1 [Polistes dominula]
MSDISRKITTISDLARSTKITDKKKSILELIELYENKEAINEINKHSENNNDGIVSWWNIITILHNLILHEADRLAMNKGNKIQDTYGILLTTLRYSHESRILTLKSNHLIRFILDILQNEKYLFYCNTYLNILNTYILPVRLYQMNITLELWEDLLKSCINIYNNESTSINKCLVLNSIQMIIQYGYMYVNLSLEVKKLIPFLVNILTDLKILKHMEESVYKLTNTVCHQMATENRIVLCQFSEEVLPKIINLNSYDDKYKLMMLFVQIHHPGGLSQENDGTYACDWSVWNSIIRSMYDIIWRDFKKGISSKYFLQFAREVINQILQNSGTILKLHNFVELYSKPAKRKCISIRGPVDLIDHCDIEDGLSVIQILTVLFAKYPERMKSDDLVPLLKILETYLMQQSKCIKVIDCLYDLCTVLMEIERLYLNVSEELQHSANVYWYKIWDILLRSLNTNNNEVSAHRLAQCFIKHGKMKNTNSLFALYVSQTIRWSSNSLQTLLMCYEHSSIPDDVSMFNTNLHSSMLNTQSVKLQFLQWLLNTFWFKFPSKILIERLSNILIGIPVRFLQENNTTVETSESTSTIYENSYLQEFLYEDSQQPMSYKNIETCSLALTFQINLITNSTKEVVNTQEYLQDSFAKANVNIIDLKELLVILKKYLYKIINKKNENNDIQMIIMKVTLVAKIAITVKKMNILMEDTEIHSIMHIIKDCLEYAYSLLNKLFDTNHEYLINVIQAFLILFETFSSTYTDMTKIIISLSTPDILRNLFNLLNIEDDNNFTYHEIRHYNDHFDIFQNNSNDGQINYKNNSICSLNAIKIYTIKTLTLFCCMNTGTKIPQIQLNLMNNLMTIDNYDFSFVIEFKMAMIILESFTQCDKKIIQEKYEDSPLLFLFVLFKKCKKDEKYVRCILKVLPYYIEYSAIYNYDLIKLMDYFYELLNCTKFGTTVYIDFLECFSKIIEIKPLLMKYKDYIHYECKFWTVMENLMTYVQSPLHILRLKVIKCIQKLYSSKSIEYQKKVYFFDKLKQTANNLLSIENKNYNDKADELETKTVSVLLIFGTIICTSKTFENNALIAILELMENKRVKLKMVQKLLESINKQVKHVLPNEDNLTSMLLYWLKKGRTIETFPYVLIPYKSQEEFYKTYINIIVFIEIQNFNIIGAKQLCASIGYDFKNIFENIFDQVLAWLLSVICQQEKSIHFSRACNMLKELMLNQGNFQTINTFAHLLETNFDKIIVCIITRLHDEKYFNEMFQLQYQYSHTDQPLVLSKTDANNCIKYIEKHFIPCKLQLYLITQKINKLQQILINLVNNIYEMKFSEDKLKALHQYIYFCTIIMKESESDYFDSISVYLIREISYSLIHFIKDKDDTISETACKYFEIFLKYILPKRHVEIEEHLNYYVTILIPVAKLEKTSTAINILEYLIIEQKKLFSNAIAQLNIFPNLPKFQRILNVYNSLKYKNGDKYNLEKEIEHFLNATNQKIVNCNMESVTYLNLQLSIKKDELQELYNKLENNSMENYNLLHRLICRLLEIIKSSDQNISIEAMKCLGQIGPIDLGTAIPYNRKTHVKENENITYMLTYEIIMLLTEFLVDNDIKLRLASANALHMILLSSWGQQIVNKKYTKAIKQMLNKYSKPSLRLDYILPFLCEVKNVKKKEIILLDELACNKYLNKNNPIWIDVYNKSYDEWIIESTCNMIECFSGYYLKDLIPVCKLSIEMCELILPRIIYLIIYINNDLAVTVSHCINGFFYYHFNNKTETRISLSQYVVNCDRNIVYFMLNLVNFIRTQVVENIPLELDFIYIAKAAQYCSAYFTAFLYAELSCESLLVEPRDFSRVTKIDYAYECEPILGKMLQNILRDVSFKIGDPDAIRGCGSSHLRDSSSRVQHYIQMQEWDKVLLIKDIELSSGNKTAVGEMISSLQQLGLHYLLGHYISTSTSAQEMSNDIQLECAWRLSNWDLPIFSQIIPFSSENNMKLKLSESDYHLYHFYALKCFNERDELGVENSIKCARICIMKALSNINLESNKEIYEKLMQLQMLSELEELCFINSEDYPKVIEKWQKFNVMNFNEFQYIEPILTQRSIMYQINDTLSNNPIIKDDLVNTHIKIAEVAQNQGHLSMAARALGTLAKQKELFSKFSNLLDYQESLLAWKRNDYEISRYLLRELIHRKSVDPVLQARVLRIYGNWMAETKSENPQTIIENYYQKSMIISKSIKTKTPDVIKNLHDTQVTLARFADAQFEHVKMYMKSSQFQSLKKCIEYSRNVHRYDTKFQDMEIKKAMMINHKQSTNDAAELENIEKEKNNYLLIAVQYYLLTLHQSEDYNLLVFRLVALWLENSKNEEVNKLLEEYLNKIPSYKFLPLVPQLAAHMNNTLDEFSMKINETLERCALDHPHHTLPVLLALKNLYGDYEFLKTNKNTKLEEPRILGAKKLLKKLASSKVSSIIQEMEILSHSLVMLANYETNNKSKIADLIKIPNNQKILRINHFSNIYVPTLAVDVKCNGNYNNVIGVIKYFDHYENVGGVNAPKKIICLGTDGIKREQLLKDKDDLRQDAVMQQVFNVMNRLFDTSKETKRRKLKIRTYKVVPLTQRSGILEWCHNTTPIINILIGPDKISGVHQKYNPNDYTAQMCRMKMQEVSNKSNDIKLQQFLECCKHMRPAFHHFFMEKYPSPEMWYEKRLAYTRSVATTSMAGYILGLGDRHFGNILMDQQTAEVIHIDFGRAFEQGKVLPMPETVPFRLTRDMEAAMGVSGVEGIMRRGCEEVLTVLRDQRQIIITLLQVLLYDPLFIWAMTPAKAYTIQTGKTPISSQDEEAYSEINKTAERVLLRIEQKLQGIEEGLVFSIPGQVEQLIQQARDPSNLCRLFSGWQAYL